MSYEIQPDRWVYKLAPQLTEKAQQDYTKEPQLRSVSLDCLQVAYLRLPYQTTSRLRHWQDIWCFGMVFSAGSRNSTGMILFPQLCMTPGTTGGLAYGKMCSRCYFDTSQIISWRVSVMHQNIPSLPTDDWHLWKCWGHSGNIKYQGSSDKAIDDTSSWIMWTITYWFIYFTCVKYLKFHLPIFAHGQIALLCSTGWMEDLGVSDHPADCALKEVAVW